MEESPDHELEINRKLEKGKVTTGVYRHKGFVYPKIVIHGDTGIYKDSSKRFFLSDEYINYIGTEMDKEFDYEYFGFKR